MTLFQTANDQFRRGNYTDAKETYAQVIRQSPEFSRHARVNLDLIAQRIDKDTVQVLSPNHVRGEAHSGATVSQDVGEYANTDAQGDRRAPQQLGESVTVIVPIFNALEDLRVCVDRLLRHTNSQIRILLIDDSSTNPGVLEFLETLHEVDNVEVLRNHINVGFTRTVNKGIQVAGSDDVVLLNSDARVTPRWLEGLQGAVASDSRIATVTPMSDRAGAFSAPNMGNDNPIPESTTEEDFAVSFRRHSLGLFPTVPTGNGFCMYIRRACLSEIGSFDSVAFPRGYGEENDFCMRAGRVGWRHVIDDRTYVFHDRNKSFGEEKDDLIRAGRAIVDERYPEYKVSTRVFSQSSTLKRARQQTVEALDFVGAGKKVKPRVLYVINSWTGGTPQTNRDLMSALTEDIEAWVLRSDGSTVGLYRFGAPDNYELVHEVTLAEPLDPLTHVSHEYEAAVKGWLRQYDFQLVHIRHLGLHSLRLPSLAQYTGARVVHSFHDFYAVCPTVKLLDERMTFCGGVCTTSAGDCKIDLWKDKAALPRLKDSWVHRWREQYQRTVLNHCDAFVTTDESVKETLDLHFSFPEGSFHIIPHGRDFQNFSSLSADSKEGGPLRVLIPGNLGIPKGSRLVKEINEIDGGESVEFHVLGRSNLKPAPGLVIHGEYDREEFEERVRDISPHISAVLSLWNETWCHTLTESWAVGLPVVATDFPTVGRRIRESGAGWLIDHEDSAMAYQQLLRIARSPSEVENRRERTLDFQKEIAKNDTGTMGERYTRVYVQALRGRAESPGQLVGIA